MYVYFNVGSVTNHDLFWDLLLRNVPELFINTTWTRFEFGWKIHKTAARVDSELFLQTRIRTREKS